MSDLESQIAAGRIEPVYVLVADEPLLTMRVTAALRDAVVPPASRAFNYDVFEAKAAGAQTIVNTARTLPMMGKHRLVIARDVDQLNAEGLEPIRKYLEDAPRETVLVLLVGKADGRLKWIQAAKKKGYLHELVVPKQVAPWIQEEARRRGVRFDSDGVRRLADVVGRDLGRLSSSIDQLALYVGKGRAIGADDVDELVAETRERTVFELANAVGSGDRIAALRAIARLFEQRESAVGVAMMLARHYRQLSLAREHGGSGGADLPRLLGVPPFAVDRILQQARKLPAAAVPRAFALLAQADRDLKGPVKGALGERVVLERLTNALLDLTSRSGPAS